MNDEKLVEKYGNHVNAQYAENTARNRMVVLRQFREFLDDIGKGLADAETYDAEDWISHLLNDDYSARSVRAKGYALSSIYDYFEMRDVVDESPIDTDELDIKKYSSTRVDELTDTRHISKDDYRDMLDACPTIRDKVLIGLLWNCGFRASEAISVRIEDIDRDDREIEVETAKQGKYESKDTRYVWYSRTFGRVLQDWLDNGGRTAYLGVEDGESGYLLVTKQADNMAVGRVNEIVHDVAVDAGIQDDLYTDASGRVRNKVTSHSLRYSYATHRIREDDVDSSDSMPLPILQKLMGHSSLDQTRSYVTLNKDDIKQAERKYRP